MSKNKFYHKNNDNKKKSDAPNAAPKPVQEGGGNNPVLRKPIEDLGLSEATLNALKVGRVSVVADLTRRTFRQMYKFQNIGKKNCIEISKALSKLGVGFAPDDSEQGQRSQNKPERRDSQGRQESKDSENRPERRDSQGRQERKAGDNRQERRDSQGRQERKIDDNRQERRDSQGRQDRKTDNNRQERRGGDNNNINRNKKQKSQEDALNEYLSRQYAGMSIAEILNGRRRRPVVEKIERPPLTEKSLIKFCRKGKWGYKDWKGNVIVPPSYEEAFGFFEERACVEMEGKLGYIDRDNNLVIDFKYDCATSFSEGLASVTVGEKSGYIDADGNQIVDFIYDVATPFSDGKAIVRANDRWGVLSRDTLSVFWR